MSLAGGPIRPESQLYGPNGEVIWSALTPSTALDGCRVDLLGDGPTFQGFRRASWNARFALDYLGGSGYLVFGRPLAERVSAHLARPPKFTVEIEGLIVLGSRILRGYVRLRLRCGRQGTVYPSGPIRERRAVRIHCVIIVYAIGPLTMHTTKVGIREFRENLAGYLESKTPVAITRHGATIGIYVPTRPKASQAELEALRVAGQKMQDLIAAAGATEDEMVSHFRRLRRERRTRKS